MAANFKRRSVTRLGADARARLPSRFDFGAWLGGDETVEADEADRRLQEEFAQPLGSTIPFENGANLGTAFIALPAPASNDAISFEEAQLRDWVSEKARELRRAEQADADLAKEYEGNYFDALTDASRAGVFVGYDDELGAAMTAPFTAATDWVRGNGFDVSEAYSRRQQQLDRQKAARRAKYPITGFAGETLGSLALGGPFGKVGPWLLSKFPQLGPTGAAALEGGGVGAFYGSGEAHPGERLRGGANGAAIGAAAGAGLQKLVDLVLPITPKNVLPEAATPLPPTPRPQRDLPRDNNAPVSERVQDIVNNPQVYKAMLEKIRHGIARGAADWYNTEEIRQRFIRGLGQADGIPAFEQFIKFVAATSANSDLTQNIRRASRAYQAARPDPGAPLSSINKLSMWLHRDNVIRIFAELLDSTKRRKTASILENFLGNLEPVTVDRHALRLPAMLAAEITGDTRFLKPKYQVRVESGKLSMADALKRPRYWEDTPTPGEYAAFERLYKNLARDLGIKPAQAQAAAWIAGADITGVSRASIGHNSQPSFRALMEERILKTAIDKGFSFDEMWDRVVRGEESILSLMTMMLGLGYGREIYSSDADQNSPEILEDGGYHREKKRLPRS